MCQRSIYSAVLDEEIQVQRLLVRLGEFLPHSLPLVRRLQFRKLEEEENAGKVWVALAPAVDDDGDDDDDDDAGDELVKEWLWSPPSGSRVCWIAAHVNITNPGQTQVWVFASWEKDFNEQRQENEVALQSVTSDIAVPPTAPPRVLPHVGDSKSPSSLPSEQVRISLLHALMAYINRHLVPQLPMSPPDSWSGLQRAGKIVSIPYRRSKVIFGTVHKDALVSLIMQQYGDRVTRTDPGYLKFVFERHLRSVLIPSTKISLSKNGERESELEFRPLERRHLQTVMDRTAIPRTMETLSSLISTGLFWKSESASPSFLDCGCDQSDMPIAWGFLGKDASLSSLHTEDLWRGRSLAAAVGNELIRRQDEVFYDAIDANTNPDTQKNEDRKEAVRWSHTDVSASNVGSRRVMEKLGGKVMWTVAWVEVDLEGI